ncbi:hypothetical protein GALL_505810 [mine drainage metagenome]|uniref:Uncharacterized protein n=1 Tax=mine drainage metagenome TaxID=410659 RepID=A0A1J5PJA4_9ZZZZ
MQRDAAEARRPPAVFDLRKPQQGRDNRQRLIDARNRPVHDRLKLLQSSGVGAPALKRESRASQRGSHVVGDIVTNTGERVDHRFHFIEHAVDDDREFRERLIDVAMRKPLAQIAGDDALNPLVDLFDAILRAHAQPRAGEQAKTEARQQAQHERHTDDMGNFIGFIDFPPHHQHLTARRAPRDRADDVFLRSGRKHLDHRDTLD